VANAAFRANISGVSQAKPCVITTDAVHGYQTNQLVRISDLGSSMPVPRGMSQLDGNRYKIIVLSTTTFSLQDPVTFEEIDSSSFEAWVSDGRINLETRVLALNNPQTYPYKDTRYIQNPFVYEAD